MTVKELKEALCEALNDDQILFCIPGTQDYVLSETVTTRTQRAAPINLTRSSLLTRRQQLAVDWKTAYFEAGL